MSSHAAAGLVGPIVQAGAIPVFVDLGPPTYNALPESIEAAISPRTRAMASVVTASDSGDRKRTTRIGAAARAGVLAAARTAAARAIGALMSAAGQTEPRSGPCPPGRTSVV